MNGTKKSNHQKTLISNGAPWEPIVGYSRAVRVGNLIYVSGTTAIDEQGKVIAPTDAYIQAKEAIKKIEKALKQAGGSLSDVIQTRIYVTDITRWQEIAKAHGEVFKDIKPATVMVEVASLIDPDMLVEIEAQAIVAPVEKEGDCYFYLRDGKKEDLSFIKEKTKEWKLDDENLQPDDFLIIEGPKDGILAFGRIKKYGSCHELGTVGVVPEWRGHGLGKKIVGELVGRFPAKEVWITTDLVDYFEKLGFQPVAEGPADLQKKISDTCRVKGRANVQIMRLKK
ncbi:MAG: GNAT family N-acetyltransferase [Elusimicrobia bacterium]|nr:GNAT family N-acetyltransferase [Elusimicrobiota bacterium]